jgi:SAM-dependent methyltransferase
MKLLTILLFILLLLGLYTITKIYYPYRYDIENFDDKFDDHETFDEIYDKEFVHLYEIIYRDYSDIKKDFDIVNQKALDPIKNKDQINILVAGCGVGKLCKKLKEKYKNIVGLDISENMLLKAQTINPNVKFIRGNLTKEKIFDKNSFSHIFIDERTLYYNDFEKITKIIENARDWIKEEGFLILPIYDPVKLQLAARYYSTKYIDDKGNVHGFTYLNDFSHDCYYIKDKDNTNNNIFHYYDKIVFPDGNKRIKKTTFHIPPKEKIYDLIMSSGFGVFHKENIRVQIVGGYELVIFRKLSTVSTVDEIEKRNKGT